MNDLYTQDIIEYQVKLSQLKQAQQINNQVGTPENVFIGNNGSVNIACASGLGFPVDYISNLGKKALDEQKERLHKRRSISLLGDLDMEDEQLIESVKKPASKRKQITLGLLHELD